MPKKKPENRHKTGFRGPSPEVGKSTQFQPGESGNPGGRPKSKPITEAYERLLKDPKIANAIAMGIAKQAKKGNVNAVREITDRVEGKPIQVQAIEGTGEGGKMEMVVTLVGDRAQPTD